LKSIHPNYSVVSNKKRENTLKVIKDEFANKGTLNETTKSPTRELPAAEEGSFRPFYDSYIVKSQQNINENCSNIKIRDNLDKVKRA